MRFQGLVFWLREVPGNTKPCPYRNPTGVLTVVLVCGVQYGACRLSSVSFQDGDQVALGGHRKA